MGALFYINFLFNFIQLIDQVLWSFFFELISSSVQIQLLLLLLLLLLIFQFNFSHSRRAGHMYHMYYSEDHTIWLSRKKKSYHLVL